MSVEQSIPDRSICPAAPRTGGRRARQAIRRCSQAFLALGIGLAGSGGIASAGAQNVTTYHNDAGRSGMYVVPGLTSATAPTAHMLAGWHGAIQGNVWGQPLYWRKPGATNGMIIIGTDQDVVQALDSVTGLPVWTASLGPNVPSFPPPCSTATASGIEGTPVIDEAAGAIYLDALNLNTAGIPQHVVYGLSLADGSVLPGWPLNIHKVLGDRGMTFTPKLQAQHSALALVNGVLYVSFGGPAGGDCGVYHGWVVGFNVAGPSFSGVWETQAEWGGIWSRGGVTYDGTSLFVTTGNTIKQTTTWEDGEAVIRLRPDLQHSADTHDFYTPKNWQLLDTSDLDVGSSGPLPIDVPITGGGTAAWLLALGKTGDAYVLDRSNLGGIKGGLLAQKVATNHIITAGASYPVGNAVYVAINAAGSACPPPAANIALTVLAITAQPRPVVGTAWCASLASSGVPIVTTSDGVADQIVWMAGSDGDMMLHGFRGDTGQVLFAGGQMARLHHHTAPIAAEGRLYVAGDQRVFAFAFGTGAGR